MSENHNNSGEVGIGPEGLPESAVRSLGGPPGLGNDPIRVPLQVLVKFTTNYFEKLGWNREEAAVAADVLVASDLRGIESHGVPRLEMYLYMFKQGWAIPNAPYKIVRETPATALVDGGGGLGLVVGPKAMELAVNKARETGLGIVTVTNSSHFGIAGYYAEMAVKQDMIGMAMTNASPVGVPTFGREPRLGSNPIAFGAPANKERPFLLDMATTTVALGKFEIAARMERNVPSGWGQDETGELTTDPVTVLKHRTMTPLGSIAAMSSFKGYGLQVMVDILCGVLSGMGHSFVVPSLRAGHFFCAMRIDAFRDVDDFKNEMDQMIRDLHETPRIAGEERIYVAGEKEYEALEQNLKLGVPLHPKVVYRIQQLSEEFDIPFEY